MISRNFLKCPGCGENFVARIGTDATVQTKFYLPCPYCSLPIRARMSGEDLDDHRVRFECEKISEVDVSEDTLVITVDPFVPSKYNADSHDGLGAFPTLTVRQLLKNEEHSAYYHDRSMAASAIEGSWPSTRMIFEYYLQQDWAMFNSTVKSALEISRPGETAHERSTIAYQSLAFVAFAVTGSANRRSVRLLERFNSKHTAAIKKAPYVRFLRAQRDPTAQLERETFDMVASFIADYESWSMGRIARHTSDEGEEALMKLTLFRDEFSLLRDLYQQGFEVICKSLWILVSAQNTAIRGDPNGFGSAHPVEVPPKSHVHTMAQFARLPNSHKIAYVSQVPGWEPLRDFLNSRRRNTIGHASARHDLRTGQIFSDLDPTGITYLSFTREVFGVFEALGVTSQILRAARITSSPDFVG
ncbi:hypothetical protein SANBI_000380 [Sanguibacter sp. 4.1]|uniref:Uncharacterized protein n=1 Tax=Sanguibacter biliveldensis TaxID=3030830 RepID=A0AAF0Z8D3_9MICO|nr:hypothetical protein [Sanguibacter sp. 4.1]WPF82766.1 hypothetical protein SANBI_000380 [Sanguibacter sp. 4.1]